MYRISILSLAASFLLTSFAWSQEPAATKNTRKRLQQKITIDIKETGAKVFFDEIKGEMDMPVTFKIDNISGISNNTKLTHKAKDQTVEKILNDISDKYEFGWFVYSNAKDPNDQKNGTVIIRKFKDKERGYEGGKAPAGASAPNNSAPNLLGDESRLDPVLPRAEPLSLSAAFVRVSRRD